MPLLVSLSGRPRTRLRSNRRTACNWCADGNRLRTFSASVARRESTLRVCAATGPQRSFIDTRSGVAKKIEEYAPTMMPTS